MERTGSSGVWATSSEKSSRVVWVRPMQILEQDQDRIAPRQGQSLCNQGLKGQSPALLRIRFDHLEPGPLDRQQFAKDR